jgi:hypothetical protein
MRVAGQVQILAQVTGKRGHCDLLAGFQLADELVQGWLPSGGPPASG